MKKYSTETFINKCKEFWGETYSYQNLEYTNSNIPILVNCSKHGDFKIRPLKFIKGRGCPCCKIKKINTKKLTNEEFINQANIVHKNKYDYSKTSYVNQKTKTIVTCKIHGDFEVIPNYHTQDKVGCKICSKERIIKSNSYSFEEFLKKANIVHRNKFYYSEKGYENLNSKIKITCPNHGEFEQSAFNHLRTSGCKQCGYLNTSKVLSYTRECFIKLSKKIHFDKYNYDLVFYKNSKEKVKIICNKHGEFEQSPAMHLQGQGCPSCNNSLGENKIYNILKSKKIEFVQQKTFIDCKNIRPLPFDFYIPCKNTLIEFQGIQHYDSHHHFGGIIGYNNLIKNDAIKKKYASDNNIKLIEIKYDDNILDVLNKNKII